MPPQSTQRQDPGEANPILVTESRARLVESFHRGAFAIADSAGRPIASLGDIARKVFPRSAIKLIQALPLVESGAADAFGLGDVELALACASHSGEPRHVEAVAAWLVRIGCAETDLVCGPQSPALGAAADILIRQGRKPTRLHNNCSGKHTGFLTLARHLGAPAKGYEAPAHPVQRAVSEAFGALAGIASTDLEIGIDGCGVPNFALSLHALATAFARIADPSPLSPSRRQAVERLTAAVRREPYFLAGTDRLCTGLVESGADVVPKGGAQGVYVAALPGAGLGLALKIDDGEKAASECLFMTLLVALAVLAEDSPLARKLVQPIFNTQGLPVGERRADLARIRATLEKGVIPRAPVSKA